jgi:hypothetical protein
LGVTASLEADWVAALGSQGPPARSGIALRHDDHPLMRRGALFGVHGVRLCDVHGENCQGGASALDTALGKPKVRPAAGPSSQCAERQGSAPGPFYCMGIRLLLPAIAMNHAPDIWRLQITFRMWGLRWMRRADSDNALSKPITWHSSVTNSMIFPYSLSEPSPLS